MELTEYPFCLEFVMLCCHVHVSGVFHEAPISAGQPPMLLMMFFTGATPSDSIISVSAQA